jgi:hypothetical protein
MLNRLAVFFSLLCLALGAGTLYLGVSHSDDRALVGAVLLSGGLILMWWPLKSWLEWRQFNKSSRRRFPEQVTPPAENSTLRLLSKTRAKSRGAGSRNA